ncbi:MAG: Ldh family oxidoreductase [Holosporales bacterium]|jgi:LDH2 family malate/lactate/ureidoglycolate dehydrogenase|nr:Ldh family oxidoreductase [Holosporales bacterium]
MVQVDSMLFKEEQLYSWGEKVLDECGLPKEDHKYVLDALIFSNLRGVDTHGINLVTSYAQKYKDVPPSHIKVIIDKGAVALIDGGANMGAIVSNRAINFAIEKASNFGIGLALAKNSNHFGAAAHYPILAANRGFIGFCSTTALVNLAPWGGLDMIVGKNPFAISFPYEKFPIVLDVSCSVAARQKVVACAREGLPIPQGWAVDKNGNPTIDAKEALEGLFLPMGEHKGVGIAIMIDLLVAALCQGGYSTEVKLDNVLTGSEPSHIGHIFIAIDPSFFIEGSARNDQLNSFYKRFHACRRIKGKEIFLPGEIEWNNFQERRKNGIPIAKTIIKELDEYSDKHSIPHICDL